MIEILPQTLIEWLETLLELYEENKAERTLGAKRSPEWSKTKREFEKLYPKVCEFCGTTKKMNLHHLKPFNLFPDLENDFNNLLWACRDCHFIFCHLKFWGSYDLNAKETAKWYRGKIENRP